LELALAGNPKIQVAEWTLYYQQSCAFYPVEPVLEILIHMLERIKVNAL